MQQFNPPALQRAQEEADARQVAAWLVKTFHQAKVNRIASRDENDWDGRRCCLSRAGRRNSATGCNDHRHLAANQVPRQRWELIVVTQRPAKIDLHILSIEIAEFAQPALERDYDSHGIVWRSTAEEPDHRHRRLLRTCRERPSSGRAAEQRDELAPFQLVELHSVPSQPGPDCRISDWQRSVRK